MNDDFETVSPVIRFGCAILVFLFFSTPMIEMLSPKNDDITGVGYYVFSVSFFLIGVASALAILRKKVVRKIKRKVSATTLKENNNPEGANIEAATSSPNQFDTIINKLTEKLWVRYLAGTALFFASEELLVSYLSLQSTTPSENLIYCFSILMLFCGGLVCMKELIAYLIELARIKRIPY
ncbi:hypothetical protein [Undibacterium sp. TC9W]|uniref:hypothetical protein n=1 Tax=Undibacterium sp. TC9W TaxID=3413053 RepID=UPI003BF2B2AC